MKFTSDMLKVFLQKEVYLLLKLHYQKSPRIHVHKISINYCDNIVNFT